MGNQGSGETEDGLSILDLVNSGTVDCKLAGLLWVLMEHRASLLVASGPSYAGKSTLMHSLLDFLPPDLQQISLQGYFEDFQFVSSSQPQKSYLVAEEISNHGFYEYLWGIKAVRAFKLLSQGYAMGATIHARNSEEVLYVLHKYIGLPMNLLSRLGIIVNLRAVAGKDPWRDEPIRRVSSVDLVLSSKLVPSDGGVLEERMLIQVLAARQFSENGFEYLPDKDLQKVLNQRSLIGKAKIQEEIDTRMRLLEHLIKDGKTTRRDVREAVQEFYNSRPA
jgi:hypothetical protein